MKASTFLPVHASIIHLSVIHPHISAFIITIPPSTIFWFCSFFFETGSQAVLEFMIILPRLPGVLGF